MNISPLIAIVPVVLAIALIIIVVRRNITERRPGEPIDIAGAIPAFVVLMVAVVFIGGMASSVAPYTWDEEDGELTINQDVGAGSQKWDSLGADVKSLVITDKVKSVADGAFDTLTGLEYISISDSVESITSSAFGVTLKDYLDQEISEPEAGEYGGEGDGVLYYADASLYTYSSSGSTITGLTDASALYLMLPNYNGDTRIVAIGDNAFQNNAAILMASDLRESTITTIGKSVFNGCTSLTAATFSAETLGNSVFQGCSSLTTATLSNATTLTYQLFFGDLVLTTVNAPAATTTAYNTFGNCKLLTDLTADSLITIGNGTFINCLALSEIILPNVVSIGTNAFQYCSAITSVSFGASLNSVQSSSFPSWTFYDTDGETVLDKTVAANLAGFTFQGTASALVKVAPGLLSLTPDQIQQVHLHDQELQTMLDQPSMDPLPFQPSLQTQEQEPVAA